MIWGLLGWTYDILRMPRRAIRSERPAAARERMMPLSREQQAEIDALRAGLSETRRASVPAIEEILYQPIAVLDHGFVRVVDYMGDDGAVVQAARVSYGRGTRKLSEDRGLINYLMRHRHTTPFEMCEIKYHVKLPIFVARQWIRHRTANVNEYSARYSILGKEAKRVLDLLREDAERCYAHYVEMLNEDEEGRVIDAGRRGLARELARINLTLNVYTQWYWKTDLHNLLHFLSLRADAHAQYEIRVYAEAMLETVKRWVPLVYEAFAQYRMGATALSAAALKVVRRLLRGEKVEQAGSGLSPREWRELMATLGLEG